jgi:hypothetical protein
MAVLSQRTLPGGPRFTCEQLLVISTSPHVSRRIISLRRSVDSITSGLVAVLQSDSAGDFIAAAITDGGLSEPAASYPCCSVTPTGFAYNSADGIYFADMCDTPSLHYYINMLILMLPSWMQRHRAPLHRQRCHIALSCLHRVSFRRQLDGTRSHVQGPDGH